MNISFHTEETDFLAENTHLLRKWITSVILDKGLIPGTLNYIFCSDEYLLKLNKQFLNHNTYTDIITFEYNKGKIVSGDIFISVDRVKDNATKFHETFNKELHRVIIHGVLHLLGMKDKTEEESKAMRAQEQHYLNLLNL